MGSQVGHDLEESILVEPWGGTSGSNWSYKLRGSIKEIVIAYGSVIDSIMFRTINKVDDCIIDSPRFGGKGGRKRLKVNFEGAPYENLRGISGTLGHYAGYFAVKSLCFITDIKSYGPFGIETGGTPFSLVMKEGGAIVGFHGRAGLYIDAIGVYLQHVTPIFAQVPKAEEMREKMDVMKTIVPRCPGPWGGCGGKGWDDGVFSAVKQVDVHMDTFNNFICGLQVQYEKKDKRSYRSELHGGLGGIGSNLNLSLGKKSTTIHFYGDEFLMGVEGFYGPVEEAAGGLDVIRQLTFYTNKKKYGPYGSDIGTYFSSGAARGKIVGFHGRSGAFLNAIGIHMEYF